MWLLHTRFLREGGNATDRGECWQLSGRGVIAAGLGSVVSQPCSVAPHGGFSWECLEISHFHSISLVNVFVWMEVVVNPGYRYAGIIIQFAAGLLILYNTNTI